MPEWIRSLLGLCHGGYPQLLPTGVLPGTCHSRPSHLLVPFRKSCLVLPLFVEQCRTWKPSNELVYAHYVTVQPNKCHLHRAQLPNRIHANLLIYPGCKSLIRYASVEFTAYPPGFSPVHVCFNSKVTSETKVGQNLPQACLKCICQILFG